LCVFGVTNSDEAQFIVVEFENEYMKIVTLMNIAVHKESCQSRFGRNDVAGSTRNDLGNTSHDEDYFHSLHLGGEAVSSIVI